MRNRAQCTVAAVYDRRRCLGSRTSTVIDRRYSEGFSLVELLAALTVALIISLAVFDLFRSNERLFRDHHLVIEMQQTARVAASQLADELRMAGQGVPIYASSFDRADSESVSVFLS